MIIRREHVIIVGVLAGVSILFGVLSESWRQGDIPVNIPMVVAAVTVTLLIWEKTSLKKNAERSLVTRG